MVTQVLTSFDGFIAKGVDIVNMLVFDEKSSKDSIQSWNVFKVQRQPWGMCLLVDDLTESTKSLYFCHVSWPRLSTLFSNSFVKLSQFAFLRSKCTQKGCSIDVIIGLMDTPCG